MSEPNWSTNQFPTVERIARTPLNETVGYDGKELFAEARRLFLLYEDLLGTLTVERLEHQTVKRSLAEAEKAVEKYWPENRCPQCGTVHPAYAARVAYAEPAMALLRELAGMRRYNPNQGYESRKTTRNTLNVPTEFLARVDALLEKHPLEIRTQPNPDANRPLAGASADDSPSSGPSEARAPGPDGEVTITTNEDGECVAVTRTDDEGRILSVLWERPEKNPLSMSTVPAEPFGGRLAMRVLQSDLYTALDDSERAQCDELIEQFKDWYWPERRKNPLSQGTAP